MEEAQNIAPVGLRAHHDAPTAVPPRNGVLLLPLSLRPVKGTAIVSLAFAIVGAPATSVTTWVALFPCTLIGTPCASTIRISGEPTDQVKAEEVRAEILGRPNEGKIGLLLRLVEMLDAPVPKMGEWHPARGEFSRGRICAEPI